ncbi:MAG: rhodanese-like domain-containing protein [Candidatus Promineofilum sp.]|nr:rhodanese-like domain-containing protein [Promineifilum sp.]
MKSRFMLVLVMVGAVVLLAACGGATEATTDDAIDLSTLGPNIDVDTAHALQSNPNVFMLDVREPDEYEAGHIPGITLIPMGEIVDRLSEIPADQSVVVTCRTGNRSAQIADLLREQGYSNVHNMDGGIVAWEEAGYAVEQ